METSKFLNISLYYFVIGSQSEIPYMKICILCYNVESRRHTKKMLKSETKNANEVNQKQEQSLFNS